MCYLRSIIFIVLPAFVVGHYIEFDDSEESKYIKSARSIVEAINNGTNGPEATIRLSPEWRRQIDMYGYDNFLRLFSTRMGRITSCDSPVFLYGAAKFQITADKGRWSMLVKIRSDGTVDAFKFIEPDPIIPVPSRNSKFRFRRF